MFLDLTHQVNLMLALQLHFLNEVLLELARIERIGSTFCWHNTALASFIFIVNLFDHDHHQVLIRVKNQILAEAEVVLGKHASRLIDVGDTVDSYHRLNLNSIV